MRHQDGHARLVARGLVLEVARTLVARVRRRREALRPRRGRWHAGVAGLALLPRAAQDLDAVALVVGVVAREVAVGLETDRGVVAREEELLPIAHLDRVLSDDGGVSRVQWSEGLVWRSRLSYVVTAAFLGLTSTMACENMSNFSG